MMSIQRTPTLLLLTSFLGLWSCVFALSSCTPSPLFNGTKGTKGFKGFQPLKTSSVATSHKPKRIALLIGINQYVDKSWHPLRFAAKDARDLAGVLKSRRHGRFDKILIHTHKAQTTRKAILKTLRQLLHLNTHRKDTVFVYISAHGTLARDSRLQLRRFIVTSDTQSRKVVKTGLSLRLLQAFFTKLNSERKVMLLATCHSGAGKSRLSKSMINELSTIKGSFFVKPFEKVSRAAVVLGVCAFGETARESPTLKNDIYTHYFIKALRRRYDANGDGAVTLSEAHDYAKELTYHYTRGRQRPYANSDILGTDPIVMVGEKKRPGKPILFAYNSKFAGIEVVVNGTPKGAFPKGITVNSGKQRVRLLSREKKVLFDGNVQFQAGERLNVSKLLQRQVFNYSAAVVGGYQFFIEGSSEDNFSDNLPVAGVEFRVRRPWRLPVDLRLEFAFGRSSHTLQTLLGDLPQTVTKLNLGVSLTYNWRIRRVTLFAGPRLSMIYLHRRSELHQNVEDFFYSFQPGAVFGLEVAILKRWSFFAQSRVNYTYVTTEDGPPKHQGSFEVLGGFYVHF